MQIRKAVLKDAKGIAKVHVDSWRTTYENIVSQDFLQNLSYEKREKLWQQIISQGTVFVAENEEGQIVGFSNGGRERSGEYPEFMGELNAIYILKDYQCQGLGKKLVKPVVEQLLNEGMYSMLVLVLEKNNACKFYEALGAEKIDSIDIEIAGDSLNEIVYGWKDIKKVNV